MDKTESLKNIEAFEYYYSLGDKRSCSKVAGKFHVSERTVYNWSSWYNWQERVKHRNREYAKKIDEQTNTSLIDAKTKYLSIINDIIEVFKTKLNDGEIRINRVNDLERLVKLEMLLREGEMPSEDRIINIIIEKDDKV
jgi:transposase